MNKILKLGAIIGLSGIAMTAIAAENFNSVVDGKGNITLPKDFRLNMAHLGSWFVPEGDASGFHDVYLDKKSVEAYRKTGKFPDGAIMVKELRHDSKANYTTGANVAFANENVKQVFVMVKDSQNRFEKTNKSWGDGWGWALFKDNKNVNVSKDYKTDCLACHVPAKDKDWIYTEAYPTLTQPK